MEQLLDQLTRANDLVSFLLPLNGLLILAIVGIFVFYQRLIFKKDEIIQQMNDRTIDVITGALDKSSEAMKEMSNTNVRLAEKIEGIRHAKCK